MAATARERIEAELVGRQDRNRAGWTSNGRVAHTNPERDPHLLEAELRACRAEILRQRSARVVMLADLAELAAAAEGLLDGVTDLAYYACLDPEQFPYVLEARRVLEAVTR